jgi:hypothetical protein
MRKYLGVLAALGITMLAVEGQANAIDGIRHNIPPAARLAEPGPMVGGPGPGVMMPETVPVDPGCLPGGGGMQSPPVQVLFNDMESMHVFYDVVGDNTFTSEPLVVPGRLEFQQGGIYRLKLTNIPGQEGIELYPTLEVGAATMRTAAYLAHNAVPVQFTDKDVQSAIDSNFVTKVIYLPDPEFQGEALSGIDTLVSTALEPGLDPIIEADRRGSILAIVRLGNKDIELAGPGAGGAYAMGGMMNPAYCGPEGMVGANPPNFVAGVTAPQYGMTQSGTPIGLVGPPHIPFGSPAGLQKHVMKNHTRVSLPDPVEKVKIHVKQQPGYSYPQPASRVHIREQNIHPGYPTGMNIHRRASQAVAPNAFGGSSGQVGDAYCPPGEIR